MRFFATARSKGVKVLAWTSMGTALVGGPLVAGMFLGDAIDTVLEAIPWGWIPPVVLGVLVVLLLRDMLLDWEPNRMAIWSLLLIPSVARATPGRLGDRIDEWTGAALELVAEPLRVWLGTSSPIALALFVGATAILLAQRSVKGMTRQAATADAW
ncbi:hypothetical protein EYA84_01940 [Verrucosispora sp. SN26_14.1]|uniref:hypothetical protein n=1 Tax=Verrucosispora sp. SN26_14.1 TaxID=2527879 RepID=UPI0010349BFE|nr:hypothetical protein [Verrucosispora sp. SN26_14.1]TBL44226.1 hypothetical protein EYA84_01940 [Verrucosispora sp. SN26_14.1]